MSDNLSKTQIHPGREDPAKNNPKSSEVVPPEEFVRMKEWIREAHSEAERARILEEQEPDKFEGR